MSRRSSDSLTICCACSVLEQEALDEMKRATGYTSDADVMRAALWHYGVHLQMGFNTDLFRTRRAKGRRTA